MNGVYNQDLGDNIILLEVGGNESTINEVANTLDLIGDVIVKKLGEELGVPVFKYKKIKKPAELPI